MPLMEPALRAGNAEPPDDLREALQRLAAARESMATAEEAFAAFCRQLAAFAHDYRLHVGDVCEELERLSAQLEALLAQRLSQRKAKRRTIPRQTPAARTVASTVTAIALSLRYLYRIAARRFHPDLARESTDREWRAAMMRRVNAAFAQGDSATLQGLLDQPAATPPISSSRLAAIEFAIAETLARTADINAAREQMEASDIGQLHAQATARGRGFDCLPASARRRRPR